MLAIGTIIFGANVCWGILYGDIINWFAAGTLLIPLIEGYKDIFKRMYKSGR